MRVVSFKIEDELLDMLEAIGRKWKVAKSEIIRRALRQYILHQDEKLRPFVTRRMKIYG